MTASADDELERQPPDAERVARRALCLSAVAARGFLESDAPADADRHRAGMVAWLEEHDLLDELEPGERALLDARVGSLEPQAIVDATWRSEGIAVLAWMLGVAQLPAHDEMVDVAGLTSDLGFLDDASALDAPRLRSEDERQWMGDRLLGLHWRLRDFSLRPEAMDFRAFAADCWFGSFDLEGIPLVDDDLAIDGQAITDADPDRRGIAHSIAMERHQAINWLAGWDAVYSQVDTST
jgi:hypothetical protein